MTKIKETEAVKRYEKGLPVYIDGGRKIPEAYLYSSNAPARVLFYRSIPYGYNGSFWIK